MFGVFLNYLLKHGSSLIPALSILRIYLGSWLHLFQAGHYTSLSCMCVSWGSKFPLLVLVQVGLGQLESLPSLSRDCN